MRYLVFILVFLSALTGSSQIGYQVSLLDNATGEPRANERVEVQVRLMDCNDKVIVSETKRVTTNDLGVLSLSIGDESTFEGFDWNNLPLFISATVDGVLIGKSQVMTVPVAEHAKHATQAGFLTREFLNGKKWVFFNGSDFRKLEFVDDYTAKDTRFYNNDTTYNDEGRYYISYNTVYLQINGGSSDPDDRCDLYEYTYLPESNSFICSYMILSYEE